MVVAQERLDARQARVRRIRRRAIPGVRAVARAEGEALFDLRARKLLGISGEEFLRRWDAGEYGRPDDSAEGRTVERLAMLIPFARRTPA